MLVVFSLKQAMENITVPRNYIPFSKPKGNDSWPSKKNTACNEKFHGGPKDGANAGFAIPGSSYVKILPCGRFLFGKKAQMFRAWKIQVCPFLVAEQNNTYMSFFSSGNGLQENTMIYLTYILHAQKFAQNRFPAKLSIEPLAGDFIYFWNFNPECLGKNSNPISTYTFLFQLPNRTPKKNQLPPP